MAITIKHATPSNVPDDGVSGVGSSEWDEAHAITAGPNVVLGTTGADASNPVVEIPITPAARALLDDADAAAMRATLNAQAQDNELTAIAGLPSAADKIPYFTGAGTAALADFTVAARQLLDDPNIAAMRATLGLVIDSTVQAFNIKLFSFAALPAVADTLPYFNSPTNLTLASITPAARALFDDVDAAAMRVTLGLGPLATIGAVGTANVADDAVTYAKLQNVSAAARLLGRVSTGAGNVEELTGTQATALLDTYTATLKGLVPPSGGSPLKSLRASGTFEPARTVLGGNKTIYVSIYTGTMVPGSGYTDGEYLGVALTGGAGTGATGDFIIAGGVVTVFRPYAQGTGYAIGNILSVSSANVGGTGSGFAFTITAIGNNTTGDGSRERPYKTGMKAAFVLMGNTPEGQPGEPGVDLNGWNFTIQFEPGRYYHGNLSGGAITLYWHWIGEGFVYIRGIEGDPDAVVVQSDGGGSTVGIGVASGAGGQVWVYDLTFYNVHAPIYVWWPYSHVRVHNCVYWDCENHIEAGGGAQILVRGTDAVRNVGNSNHSHVFARERGYIDWAPDTFTVIGGVSYYEQGFLRLTQDSHVMASPPAYINLSANAGHKLDIKGGSQLTIMKTATFTGTDDLTVQNLPIPGGMHDQEIAVSFIDTGSTVLVARADSETSFDAKHHSIRADSQLDLLSRNRPVDVLGHPVPGRVSLRADDNSTSYTLRLPPTPGTSGLALKTDGTGVLSWGAAEGAGIKTPLSADTTYYMSTTGSDSNNGLTVGTPWATAQKAVNWIRENIDLNGFTATVQCADGTYQTTVPAIEIVNDGWLNGRIKFQGNAGNRTAVRWERTTNGFVILTANVQMTLHITNIQIVAAAANIYPAIEHDARGFLRLENCDLGTGGGWCHLLTTGLEGCTVGFFGTYSVLDSPVGAAGCHIYAQDSAYVNMSATINFPTQLNFPAGFVYAVLRSQIDRMATGITGTPPTGKKYVLMGNSILNLYGNTEATIPGTLPGFVRSGVVAKEWSDHFSATTVREKLTADRTYYVSTTGNDANDGLTAGTAWATVQGAYNYLRDKVDLSGKTVTIQFAAGTYTGAPVLWIDGAWVGGGLIQFVGIEADSSQVVWQVSENQRIALVAHTGDGKVWFKYIKMVNLTGAAGYPVLSAEYGAKVHGTNLEVSHQGRGIFFAVGNGTNFMLYGTLKILCTEIEYLVYLTDGPFFGFYVTGGVTATQGSVYANNSFFAQTLRCQIDISTVTWTGTFTGRKWYNTNGSWLNAYGAASSTLPGNTPGETYSAFNIVDGLYYGEYVVGDRILFNTHSDFTEVTPPANPAANRARLYAKDVNGATRLAYRDSVGAETVIDNKEVLTADRTYYMSVLSGTIVGGSGYTDGAYANISLTGGAGTGAVADIIVSGGAVTVVKPSAKGTGYAIGNVLSGTIPGGSGFTFTLTGIGSDANNGTTAALPWATAQAAMVWVREHIDFNGYIVTVQCADGIYKTDTLAIENYKDGWFGKLKFQGNTGDRTRVRWERTNDGYLINTANVQLTLYIAYIQLIGWASSQFPTIEHDAYGLLRLEHCDLGGGGWAHILTTGLGGGMLSVSGTYSVFNTATADNCHIFAQDDSYVMHSATVNFPTQLNFELGFFYAVLRSQIDRGATGITGTQPTGPKYILESNSIMNLYGFTEAAVPGTGAPLIRSGTIMKEWDNVAIASKTDFLEQATPGNPAANNVRVYARDVSGATKLAYRDSTGAETLLDVGSREILIANRAYYISILSGTIAGGSGYTDGTYANTSLTGGTGSGAVADIVVSGGAVTAVMPSNAGAGYAIGNVLSATIPGGSGFTFTLTAIGSNANDGRAANTPWATLQYANNYVQERVDLGGGKIVTFNVADGKHAGVSWRSFVGNGIIYWKGNVTNPQNVVIGNAAYGIGNYPIGSFYADLSGGGPSPVAIWLNGFKCTPDAGPCIDIDGSDRGLVLLGDPFETDLGKMIFAGCQTNGYVLIGNIWTQSALTGSVFTVDCAAIAPRSPQAFWWSAARHAGSYLIGEHFNFTASITFSVGFIVCRGNAQMMVYNGAGWGGAANVHGKKYNVGSPVASLWADDLASIPGDQPGIVTDGFVSVGDVTTTSISNLLGHREVLTADRTYYVSILSGTIVGGTGYTNGTYEDVSLTGGTGSGAVADIVVSGGAVTIVKPSNAGAGYTVGNALSATIPGGSGFTFTLTAIGNDVNDGTLATAPWATPQHAFDVIRTTLDLNMRSVNIQHADGIWLKGTQPFFYTCDAPPGNGNVNFKGHASDRTRVRWEVTVAGSVVVLEGTLPSTINFDRIQLVSAASGYGLAVTFAGRGYASTSNCDVGVNGAAFLAERPGCMLSVTGTLSVLYTPGGGQSFFRANDGGFLNAGATVDFPVNVDFPGPYAAFIRTDSGGQVDYFGGFSGSGTVTGYKFIASMNGVVNTGGAGDFANMPGTGWRLQGGGSYNRMIAGVDRYISGDLLAEFAEQSGTLPNPEANKLFVYAKDDSGVTRLMSRDSTGTDTPLGGRTILTADRTYYVATTGSNSNDGLTAGTPWATAQYAYDWIRQNIDVNGKTVTVQMADGTYSASGAVLSIMQGWTGAGIITFQGNTGNRTAVRFNTTGGANSAVETFRPWTGEVIIRYIQCYVTAGYTAVDHRATGILRCQYCDVASGASSAHYSCGNSGSLLYVTGDFTVLSSGSSLFYAWDNGFLYNYSTSITASGTINFTGAFAGAVLASTLEVYTENFVGTFTGKKFNVDSNSLLNIGGLALDGLPGNAGGTVAGGGVVYYEYWAKHYPISKDVLAADRTYYVATTGSNTNNGRSAASPWATPQYAFDWIRENLDLNRKTVTVQLADGTYSVAGTVLDIIGWAGGGALTFQGNASDRTAVKLNVSSGSFVCVQTGGTFPGTCKLQDMQCLTPGYGAINHQAVGTLVCDSVDVSTNSASTHYIAGLLGSRLSIHGDYTVLNSAASHLSAYDGSYIYWGPTSITASGGSIAFSSAFAYAFLNAHIDCYPAGATITGTFTGKYFSVDMLSVLNLYAGSLTSLPGNAAGTVSGGSQVKHGGTLIFAEWSPTTVGALPAAGVAGRRSFVTDANATTFASVVASGGSNGVPVYDDGASWRIG